MKSYNGFSAEQRYASLKWLHEEYAAGRRRRPTACCACGQTKGVFEAHAEDYSEPFGDHIDAYGLCYVCHMLLHCRFAAPAIWEQYRARVLSGWMPTPSYRREWGRIRKILGGGAVGWQRSDGKRRPFFETFGAVEAHGAPGMFD